jgi:hypothetical protein
VIDIEIGQLTPQHVGRRVIITRDGSAFDGMLTGLDVERSDYLFKDRPRVTARLTVKVIEPGEGIARSDTTLAEAKLNRLPLDYRIQVETNPEPVQNLNVEGGER